MHKAICDGYSRDARYQSTHPEVKIVFATVHVNTFDKEQELSISKDYCMECFRGLLTFMMSGGMSSAIYQMEKIDD